MSEELSILAKAIEQPEKFKADIENYIKRRQEAEAAEVKLRQAMTDHEKSKTDTDAFVNKKKAELVQAQQAHDKAAKEAADRVRVGNEQVAELMRVKTELEKREAGVKAREADAAAKVATADAQTAQLDKWRREVLALKESLQKKHAAITRAMQEG
jgi:chromosome segregation ATPase